jgi:tRNA threonylcarbamoyladenosine biosynthesis protein TsaB
LNILVIDTATELEIIAACAGGAVAGSAEPSGISHSVTLMDTLDRCLKTLGITAAGIDVVGVGVGPGSFTGIRIAVSTCRMLAQVLGKPLVGVHTQLLYAVSAEADINDNILVAFDAKKGRVFGALYRRRENPLGPEVIVPPGDYEIGRLIERVDPSGTTRLIGSGAVAYRDALAVIEKGVFQAGFIPSYGAMCGLVRETYLADPGEYADCNKVVPCYARKSDAEVAKDPGGNR